MPSSLDAEIDAERKKWESDKVWAIRKAFLQTHWDRYPKDQLQCLSQLFVNVNMIGCEYSAPLMAKIREMGVGIEAKASHLENELKYVRASRVLAAAEETNQRDERRKERERAQTTMAPPPQKAPSYSTYGAPPSYAIPQSRQQAVLSQTPQSASPDLDDKLKMLKGHMEQAFNVPALVKLNMVGRVKLHWFSNVLEDGTTEVRIRQLLVLRHKFIHVEDAKSASIAAVVDSFVSCEPAVQDNEIRFDGSPAALCYRDSLQRRINKAHKTMSKDLNTFKALSEALASCDLQLLQNATHLQGWSQRVDLLVGDALLASRVLNKGECVKARLVAAVDEMCAPVCHAIRAKSLQLTPSPSGGLIIQTNDTTMVL